MPPIRFASALVLSQEKRSMKMNEDDRKDLEDPNYSRVFIEFNAGGCFPVLKT